MDYISSKIENRISIVRNINTTTDLMVLYQSRLEFQMTYLLGYLWNKNKEKLDEGLQKTIDYFKTRI